MMEITPRHWLIAVLIASLVHAAFLALVLVRPSPPPPESSLGMTIELGDGGQSTARSGGGPPGAKALRPVVSPTLGITPADAPDPIDIGNVATEADTRTSDRVRKATPASTIVAKARPEFKPEPEPKRQQNTASTLPSQSRDRAGGGVGDRGDGSAGTSGSGGKASASNYYGRLATWLARHQDYPAQARRLGQEGTVKVTFTVDNNGRLVSKRITQSSGHALLDREAQAMLERASPLPRIPASLGRSNLTITLPVAFKLR